MNEPRIGVEACKAAQAARQFFSRAYLKGSIDPDEAETMEALLAATETQVCAVDAAVVRAFRDVRRGENGPANRERRTGAVASRQRRTARSTRGAMGLVARITHPEAPTTNESAATGALAQRVRVNVAKTATKGYTADTTVEVAWEGDPAAAMERLDALLAAADAVARQEIRSREALDRGDDAPR